MSTVWDTCALLAWTTSTWEPPVQATRPFIVSAISWCEVAWKHRASKLPLPVARDDYFASLRALELVPEAIDADLLLAAVDLDWDHRDPADRLLVALARRHRCAILTCDRRISDWHPHCLW